MCGLGKCLAFLLIVLFTVGCEEAVQAPRAPSQAAAPVDRDVLARAGLEYYWRYVLKLSPDEHIVRIDRIDENFYCLSSDRRFIAVDAQRPRLKWVYTIGQETETIFRPVHADAMVLREQRDGIQDMLHPKEVPPPPPKPFDGVMVNTVSALVVLDRKTGRRARVIGFDFAANTDAASDGVNFYVASTRGYYYAIHMGPEVPVWTMSTDDVVTAPVEHYDGNVYVGSQDKTMCAAAGRYRKLLWRREFSGPIVAEFQVDGRGVFVGTLDGRIYALDRMTGQQIKIPDPETKGWMDWGPFICNGEIRDPIQVGRNTIFQYVRGDKFYAIDVNTGKLRWTHPNARVVLAVIGATVYVLDKDRTLLLVEEGTGKVRTSVPMTGWELFVPNVSLSAVYAAAGDGRLCCIRPKGSGHLTAEMLNPRLKVEKKKAGGG